MLWTQAIELLQALIFSVAHVFNGSLGLAVVVVSVAIRLVLLPLTMPLARRALANQRRLAALKPELDRLRKRYAKDPTAQWRETAALYERRGVKAADPASLAGALVQMPIFVAFFAALRRGIGAGIRFLWMGDLALPNLLLTLVVALVTVAGVAATPAVDPGRGMPWLPMAVAAVFTIWILSSTSAMFALASGAGSLVNVLQGLLLRREERRRPA